MKKLIFTTSLLVIIASICFAVPRPNDKSSIAYSLPAGVATPAVVRTPQFSKPYPTNKWFNSLIYNDNSAKSSIGMYTQPQLHIISYQTIASQRYTGCLLIGYPRLGVVQDCFTYSSDVTDPFRSQLCVAATDASGNPKEINVNDVRLKSFSDWACTIDNGQYEASFGQGMLFTYFDFKNNSNAAIFYPNNIAGNSFKIYKDSIVQTGSFTADKFVIEIITNDSGFSATRYYGVFLPKDIQVQVQGQKVNIFFSDADRYMSVALMTSKEDINDWYKYAYNFVTDTKAEYSIKDANIKSKTEFKFTFTQKRSGGVFVSNQTLFALMPHHYKKSLTSFNYFNNKEFLTLRGKMKVVSGNSFTTQYQFQGIVPFFNYNLDGTLKTQLQTYLNTDKNMQVNHEDTYRSGKIIAKLANLLPAADNLNDETAKLQIITKLRYHLINWLTYKAGETSKYFVYDSSWGGIIGIKTIDSTGADFGTARYNDHHFHYGYFIYAAAILAMYDDTFAQQYGDTIELLIKDIANIKRNDNDFPYMRCFDIYEGHSWASGMGGAEVNDSGFVYSDSTDEESSSEAMNAWSAIYIWGLATNNQNHINLGINLYTTHYNAIREYYLDMDSGQSDEEIYPSSMLDTYGNFGSVGILYGGRAFYYVHWYNAYNAKYWDREIKGIQILPMTPAMTYWGYEKNYTKKFYEKMEEKMATRTNVPNYYYWNDVWTRMQSLYDPAAALTNFNNHHSDDDIDEGGSATLTYHFINFFNKYGAPTTSYTADFPSYLVTEKNSVKIFSVYNPTVSNKTVRFYDNSGKNIGSINVNAKSFVSTSSLIQNQDENKFSVFPVPYKPGSGGKYDGKGITFSGLSDGSNIKIFNIAGEMVFEDSVSSNSDYYLWDGKNNSGSRVASGIYIYFITSKGQKIKGKIAIER